MLLGFIFVGATALILTLVVAPTVNNLIILAHATNIRSRHHGKALEILKVAHIKDGDEGISKVAELRYTAHGNYLHGDFHRLVIC